ncbi:hypothetical protein Pcinc_014028 [Petrolisthes cinctipes]|uniref:Uncharacterized protein n=1 Tax=Petrolisthes cinctipes TaxID=88211 RepID=A0AAE1FVS4_PETCI|nr:hypothetical protein Pcinc_014028 [Petrolisthes cinctipes]
MKLKKELRAVKEINEQVRREREEQDKLKQQQEEKKANKDQQPSANGQPPSATNASSSSSSAGGGTGDRHHVSPSGPGGTVEAQGVNTARGTPEGPPLSRVLRHPRSTQVSLTNLYCKSEHRRSCS